MSQQQKMFYIPSLVKKYLMGITGFVLAGFVMGHMIGNLQFFAGPDVINAYALELHSLPFHLLYVIRAFLLLCLVVHVVMAILLVKENRAARKADYDDQKTQAATLSAKLMPITGVILLVYIVFHLLHFTIRVGPGEFAQEIGNAQLTGYGGEMVEFFDVYAMMATGFQHYGTSIFYVIAVGLLCLHLTHGVSSMFQSLGLRNETWRPRLNLIAKAYGWVVFLGFAAVPVSVMFLGAGKEYLAEIQEAENTSDFESALGIDLDALDAE